MRTYKLTAGTTGYEVILTESQASHMLALWGEQYNIDTCTNLRPIFSPSGYTKLELISIPAMVAERALA